MSDDHLPESRLGTTDESGKRIYINPHDVEGKWKNLRKKIYWFLIGLYLILPWIYINGKQIILLDLPNREFYIFGTTFYGHDGPLLIYIFLGFLFFISFVTSKWGRVWCGYACPQTVYIDTLYRTAERWIEGSGPKRDRLEAAAWSIEKFIKRFSKWTVYLAISLHIVHSGLGYFVGTRNLLKISFHSPQENMTLFITMLILTGIILLDFGWFREQFCIIACPYGRFQSLFMDESSLIVAYDKKRGEPRKRTAGIEPKDQGDCVNCNRCVHVCPTGIDIRDGLQMECIACTMCIDACDDIMRRVNKPEGLIRYSSEVELDGEGSKKSLRSYVYLGLFIIVTIACFSHLTVRKELKIQFLRGGQTPYQIIKMNDKETILNHFNVKLMYQSEEDLKVDIKIKGNEEHEIEIVSADFPVKLNHINQSINVFLKFDKKILINGEKKIVIIFNNTETKKIVIKKEVSIVGPNR